MTWLLLFIFAKPIYLVGYAIYDYIKNKNVESVLTLKDQLLNYFISLYRVIKP